MPVKSCVHCGEKIPVACKACPRCQKVLPKKENNRVATARQFGPYVFLNDGRLKLEEYQELIVPNATNPLRRKLELECKWCGARIDEKESRVSLRERRRAVDYHMGCWDAKEAGCKPPTRLR
jgi:predicted nucleic acid-binding Zn ribbon protein